MGDDVTIRSRGFDGGEGSKPRMTQPRLYTDLVDMWRLVSPPENYVEEVATFVTRFEKNGIGVGSRVLHLGSGGGSIDYQLKQQYRVTGVDLSSDMVEHARSINPDVTYHVGDIRGVRLGESFDAVLVHDAISYMTTHVDLAAAYRTAAAHLVAGGVMVALPEEMRERLHTGRSDVETHRDGDRTVTIIQLDHDADPSDNMFEMDFIFLIREGTSLRVEVDRHTNGVFELREFVEAIEAAGFDVRVDPWELSDWKADEVPMPLITAVLKAETGRLSDRCV